MMTMPQFITLKIDKEKGQMNIINLHPLSSAVPIISSVKEGLEIGILLMSKNNKIKTLPINIISKIIKKIVEGLIY